MNLSAHHVDTSSGRSRFTALFCLLFARLLACQLGCMSANCGSPDRGCSPRPLPAPRPCLWVGGRRRNFGSALLRSCGVTLCTGSLLRFLTRAWPGERRLHGPYAAAAGRELEEAAVEDDGLSGVGPCAIDKTAAAISSWGSLEMSGRDGAVGAASPPSSENGCVTPGAKGNITWSIL